MGECGRAGSCFPRGRCRAFCHSSECDVRQLPFADDEFDAIVSIDAFEYFGTDVHLLPALLRVLKSGGTIGMTTPGLEPDPYEADVPDAVWLWEHEVAAWHSGGADTGS